MFQPFDVWFDGHVPCSYYCEHHKAEHGVKISVCPNRQTVSPSCKTDGQDLPWGTQRTFRGWISVKTGWGLSLFRCPHPFWEVRGSTKSGGLTLWQPWMSEFFITIRPVLRYFRYFHWKRCQPYSQPNNQGKIYDLHMHCTVCTHIHKYMHT